MMAPLERHPPQFGEGVECGSPSKPTVARIPDAAKRGLRLVVHRLVVDVHDAGAKPVGNLETTTDIFSTPAVRP
jgi:hypothetical protein